MGLIGIIIASVVNIFYNRSQLAFAISVIGVLVLLVSLHMILKILKICIIGE